MAKVLFVFSPIFLLLVFLVAMSEIARVKGQLCERESQTYSGLICHRHWCDRKCISWEKAVHGACHLRDWKVACYCYFETCANKPPLPPPPSSSGGGSGGAGTGGAGNGTGGAGGGWFGSGAPDKKGDGKKGDACGKEGKLG